MEHGKDDERYRGGASVVGPETSTQERLERAKRGLPIDGKAQRRPKRRRSLQESLRANAERIVAKRPELPVVDGMEIVRGYPDAEGKCSVEGVGRILPEALETPTVLVGEPIHVQIVAIVRGDDNFGRWSGRGMTDEQFAASIYRRLRTEWAKARMDFPIVLRGRWEGLCEAEREAMESKPTQDPEGRLLPGFVRKPLEEF